MSAFRLHRWPLWLAALAALWQALAPLAANARPALAGTPLSFVQVCTSLGVKRIALPAGEGADVPAAPSAQDGDDPCPYCRLQGAGAAPLPATPRAWAAAPQPHAAIVAPVASLHPRLPWAPGTARGPPAAS